MRERIAYNMFVVFDLDGTLALTDHRAHFLTRPSGEKDWRGFYAACDKDLPSSPMVRTLVALTMAGHDVEIWSGRSKEVDGKTATWLAAHGIDHVPIRMREVGDHRPDTTVKLEWLTEASRKPDLIFEDRASVVAMWRAQGIVCAQAREIEELRNPKPSGGPEWAAEMKREKKRLRAPSRTGDGNG